MKKVLTNCHLISDGIEYKSCSIVIEDKRIVKIAESVDIKCNECIDLQGRYVVPGFIDIHCHGGGGSHVCDGELISIGKIAVSKLKEGVTTFCPSTVTAPIDILQNTLRSIAEYKEKEVFSKIEGVHLEGPFLNAKQLGGQNPAYVIDPNIKLIKELNSIAPVSIVSYSPELKGAEKFMLQLKELGIVGSAAHTAATYNDIVNATSSGLTHLTHFCNQMSGLHHREIGVVGAGFMLDNLRLELICDKIHLAPEMLQLIFKRKDLNNLMLITDSSYLTGLDDGVYELRGMSVEMKNGVPRLRGSDTLSGSTLRYNIGLKNIVELTGLPLKDIIKTTSLNQARSLGIEDVGKLEVGYYADITVMDKEFNVTDVFVNGYKKV